MKCIISDKETTRKVKNQPFSKDVLEFARWYRDKLNIQQNQKINEVIKKNNNIDAGKAMVDLTGVLNMFIKMRRRSYGFDQIKDTLVQELYIKGIISENKYI